MGYLHLSLSLYVCVSMWLSPSLLPSLCSPSLCVLLLLCSIFSKLLSPFSFVLPWWILCLHCWLPPGCHPTLGGPHQTEQEISYHLKMKYANLPEDFWILGNLRNFFLRKKKGLVMILKSFSSYKSTYLNTRIWQRKDYLKHELRVTYVYMV